MIEWICELGIAGLGQILFCLVIAPFLFWAGINEWGWWRGILGVIGIAVAFVVAAAVVIGIFTGLAWLITKAVCP